MTTRRDKNLAPSSHTYSILAADKSRPAIVKCAIFFLLKMYPPKSELGIPINEKVIAPIPTCRGLSRHFSSSQGAIHVVFPPICMKIKNKITETNIKEVFELFMCGPAVGCTGVLLGSLTVTENKVKTHNPATA
jgi:hypothetical protein